MIRDNFGGMKRLSARVDGTVQGVGFRMFVRREAAGRRLTGYVRNREDGSVETVAEGPEESLRELAAQLRRGPAGAVVRRLETDWSEATGEFSRFEIRP